MLKLVTTHQFEKDFKRMIRRGRDKDKILQVMQNLINQKPLDARHKNHSLKGLLVGRMECHVEPDWILIYIKEHDKIIFERTGTHSDLFG